MASEGDARPPAVVGVDGSEGSVAALRWAVRYGAATGTPVRAVLAWHYPTAAGQPPVGHAPEAVNKEVEGHETAILREAIGKVAADAPGADVHGEVRYGHPVEVLVEESGHADVLVVGRRGRRLTGAITPGAAATTALAIAVSEFGTSRASWRLRIGPPKYRRSAVLR
jgi:Universal stress protein family